MITKKIFGEHNGEKIYAYTLENNTGVSATIMNYGATLLKLCAPDRNGEISDVIGGFDSIESYRQATSYQGATIGRVGNRIADGKFTLDGVDYTVACNNGKNHLHGGNVGFDKRIWTVEEQDCDYEPRLVLSLLSPDGEEGYPGTLKVTVTYTLTANGGIRITYKATTDKRTVINLTNHSYFNLGGYASGKIFSHVLTLDADAYLPTDDTLIPTGELRAVEGTSFDFRSGRRLGISLESGAEDLKVTNGYDNCVCFVGGKTDEPVWRGNLYSPETGRSMDLYTDQPAVQVYSGNFLNPDEPAFKGGYKQEKQTFVCLETQHYPNSINTPHFTNTMLYPDEVFESTTEYRFSVK